MEEDRRGFRRADAFRIGSLAPHASARAIDCLVWDHSETGARLEVEAEAEVPDDFVLSMTVYARPRRCRVVWRKGRRIGISFVA